MTFDQIVYSGYIDEKEGFDSPSLFKGPPGWSVFKSQQTEIYQVTHNLQLSCPENQLHVVVQTMKTFTLSQVSLGDNQFIISTWLSANGAPASTSLMFIATFYPFRR